MPHLCLGTATFWLLSHLSKVNVLTLMAPADLVLLHEKRWTRCVRRGLLQQTTIVSTFQLSTCPNFIERMAFKSLTLKLDPEETLPYASPEDWVSTLSYTSPEGHANLDVAPSCLNASEKVTMILSIYSNMSLYVEIIIETNIRSHISPTNSSEWVTLVPNWLTSRKSNFPVLYKRYIGPDSESTKSSTIGDHEIVENREILLAFALTHLARHCSNRDYGHISFHKNVPSLRHGIRRDAKKQITSTNDSDTSNYYISCSNSPPSFVPLCLFSPYLSPAR